ncbi:MAG: hypothetical protein OIN90_04535 [Candidatus Methanoperedens sp.]|nr:hypothetical protein [Candidatus Methanoperedens sp.]
MICRFAPPGLTLPQPFASLRTSAVLAAARTPAILKEKIVKNLKPASDLDIRKIGATGSSLKG